jgi:ribosome-associated translation inhibitor RaiA
VSEDNNQKERNQTMKIMIQHMGVRSTDALDGQLESHLIGLQAMRQIDAAHVEIARRWEDSPPFVVRIHLVTPGPDVRVEGADQTASAAVRKALNALDADLRRRAVRRSSRVKTNLQAPPLGRQGLRR